jgi:hypothetical protein
LRKFSYALRVTCEFPLLSGKNHAAGRQEDLPDVA